MNVFIYLPGRLEGFRDFEELHKSLRCSEHEVFVLENNTIIGALLNVRRNRASVHVFSQSLRNAITCIIIGKMAKIAFDIRSVSVSDNKLRRNITNYIYMIAAKFAKTSIISREVKDYLKIKKAKIINLGGSSRVPMLDELNSTKKYNFIYIGSINGRKLYDLDQFLERNILAESHIDFYGDISLEEKKILERAMEIWGTNFIFHGWKSFELLDRYVCSKHIGLAFVPLDEKYRPQVPGKIYDYMGFGIPTLCNLYLGTEHFHKDDRTLTASYITLSDMESYLCNSQKIMLRNDEKWEYLTKKWITWLEIIV